VTVLPFRPASRHGLAAVIAANIASCWEILVDVLTRRRSLAAMQDVLNALKGLEGYEALMLAFRQRLSYPPKIGQ
jgi:hypothetical protein